MQNGSLALVSRKDGPAVAASLVRRGDRAQAAAHWKLLRGGTLASPGKHGHGS
jgi:hypothetical protein